MAKNRPKNGEKCHKMGRIGSNRTYATKKKYADRVVGFLFLTKPQGFAAECRLQNIAAAARLRLATRLDRKKYPRPTTTEEGAVKAAPAAVTSSPSHTEAQARIVEYAAIA